ncbi:hypothetical protein [Flavobacterium sp.]|uniref:hypothetical protein n=1 Tax=Flavobacterium sp. TaxID=239 RepID=UPI00374FED19
MRKLLFLFIIGLAISITSCRKDFVFEPSTGGLEFSKDTVYLDTIFTNIGSSTYRLKVYNNSDKDISIPKIQLRKGITSKYRITVDGLTGDIGATNKIFSNVELLAKDSLFIFIEVTADAAITNPNDFLYTDNIDFYNISGTPQDVDLVTLIQDAIFIYPDKPLSTGIKETLTIEGLVGVEGHTLTLPNELNWTSLKPYVIYGYAAVPNGSTLTINDGTSVYFHANSGLVIDNQAKLIIDGHLNDIDINGEITAKHEVTFEGDRLESSFENVPGQWGTVLIFSSLNNTINHLTLKNSAIGLYLQTNIVTGNPPKLEINESQIYNSSNVGILARNSNINGRNLVINNAGQFCLSATYGGNYKFTHSTFINNWPSSKQLAVLLNDYLDIDATTFTSNPNPSNFEFINCIIYGSNNTEFFVNKKGTATFTYNLKNCLIKFNSSQLNDTGLFEFNNITGPYSNSCFISKNNINYSPKFKNITKNQLWPTVDLSLSPSLMPAFLSPVNVDILNKPRTPTITIGAYQFIP